MFRLELEEVSGLFLASFIDHIGGVPQLSGLRTSQGSSQCRCKARLVVFQVGGPAAIARSRTFQGAVVVVMVTLQLEGL